MAKRTAPDIEPKSPETLDVPWAGTGDEIVEPGIGQGFVEWKKHGESLRGKLLHRWQSRAMKSPAVTIELTEKPQVRVINTENAGRPKTIKCGVGDLVNMSLSYDLGRKLTTDLEGAEVGVFYSGDQPTPKGTMRVFKVFAFEPTDQPF